MSIQKSENPPKKEYNPQLIDKSVNKYLSKKIVNMPSETEPSKTKENIRYFKLLFIKKFSNFTKIELERLTNQFRKEDANIKIIFSTFKVASLF